MRTNDYLEALGGTFVARYISSCNATIPLSKLLDFGNGFTFKRSSYADNGNYKILTIKNVHDGNVDCSNVNRIDAIPKNMKGYCRLQIGDVVLSLTGNVGRVGIVTEDNCLLNQRVAVLLPKRENTIAGLYFWFRQDDFRNRMIGIARGTAQSNLSTTEMLRLKIPYNSYMFNKLCEDVLVLFDAITANKMEILLLSNLRDTILPKLMSGEIDVSDIELPKQSNNHLLFSHGAPTRMFSSSS